MCQANKPINRANQGKNDQWAKQRGKKPQTQQRVPSGCAVSVEETGQINGRAQSQQYVPS
jgi:hypothetical protein